MSAKTVLVLGATGRVGRFLVPLLHDRGLAVRALVRDSDGAGALLGNDATFIQGDLRNPADLAEAAKGCSHVIFLAAAYGGPGRGTPREIDYGAVEQLVALLDPAELDRFVLVSSAAVTQPEHPHNCTFGSVLKWKLRGEDALRASGLAYTIVRALGLRDRPRGQHGIRIVQGDRIAFGEDIAREDVAAFLADVILPAPGSQGFAHDFDTDSLRDATCEIFNDAGVPPETWEAGSPALHTDPLPPSFGARP